MSDAKQRCFELVQAAGLRHPSEITADWCSRFVPLPKLEDVIAGAVGMELALLVVSADEGVMPQTREHLAACEILGIGRLVVAITKIDRVERDLAAREDEIAHAHGLRIRADGGGGVGGMDGFAGHGVRSEVEGLRSLAS